MRERLEFEEYKENFRKSHEKDYKDKRADKKNPSDIFSDVKKSMSRL
jgi:hypothetical protein